MNITQQVGNIPYRRESLGYGDTAIYNTISKMSTIIKRASSDIYVRKWAEYIIQDVKQYDKVGELRAIHDFVKYNVRYTKDPQGVEYIQTPDLLLKMIEDHEIPMGDCDDMTTLSMALVKSIGFPVILKVASYTPAKRFQHIYGLVRTKKGIVAFDCIKEDKGLGWEAPNPTRIYEKVV